MYARSTTINAKPGSIDAGIARLRDEVMPTILEMDGCIGLSMLADRESGRCIATSAWQSEEAMRATDEELSPIREQLAQMMGGSNPKIEEWEIAVLHRDHRSVEGACVRATWVKVDPATLDRAIDVYKLASLPRLEDLAGFCSASLLVDRANGRGCGTARFEDRASMMAAAPASRSLREDGVQQVGFHVMDVEEFDLAIAHLRVPELV